MLTMHFLYIGEPGGETEYVFEGVYESTLLILHESCCFQSINTSL